MDLIYECLQVADNCDIPARGGKRVGSVDNRNRHDRAAGGDKISFLGTALRRNLHRTKGPRSRVVDRVLALVISGSGSVSEALSAESTRASQSARADIVVPLHVRRAASA